jgi:hypothetical protein
MTDPVTIALIAATPPTVVALGALVASIRNNTKIEELHISVNSRLTELLKQTGIAAHAEGLAQGKAEGVKESKGT